MSFKAKFLIVTCALLAGVCGIGGFFLLKFVDYPTAAAELPKAIADAKAVGIPLTAQELAPDFIDPDSGTTLGIMQSFESGSTNGAIAKVASQLDSRSPDWAGAKKTIAEASSALAKARTLSNRPGFGIEKDLDMGSKPAVPRVLGRKGDCEGSLRLGQLSAHEKDFEKAGNDLAAAKRIGPMCSQQSNVIGLLVQVAIDAIVDRQAEFCLAEAAGSKNGIGQIRKAVLAQPSHYDLRRAFLGEAYTSIATTRNLDKYGGLRGVSGFAPGTTPRFVDPTKIRRSGDPPNMVQRAYMARSLQFWTKCLVYMDNHPGDEMGLVKFLDSLSRSEGDRSKGLSRDFVYIVTPVFTQAGLAFLKAEASRRCLFALSMALQHSAEHGKFPGRLSDVGVSLLDPFDGKPLRYSVKNSSARVWSVGTDLKDDSGIARSELKRKGGSETYDLVSSYPPLRRL